MATRIHERRHRVSRLLLTDGSGRRQCQDIRTVQPRHCQLAYPWLFDDGLHDTSAWLYCLTRSAEADYSVGKTSPRPTDPSPDLMRPKQKSRPFAGPAFFVDEMTVRAIRPRSYAAGLAGVSSLRMRPAFSMAGFKACSAAGTNSRMKSLAEIGRLLALVARRDRGEHVQLV